MPAEQSAACRGCTRGVPRAAVGARAASCSASDNGDPAGDRLPDDLDKHCRLAGSRRTVHQGDVFGRQAAFHRVSLKFIEPFVEKSN